MASSSAPNSLLSKLGSVRLPGPERCRQEHDDPTHPRPDPVNRRSRRDLRTRRPEKRRPRSKTDGLPVRRPPGSMIVSTVVNSSRRSPGFERGRRFSGRGVRSYVYGYLLRSVPCLPPSPSLQIRRYLRPARAPLSRTEASIPVVKVTEAPPKCVRHGRAGPRTALERRVAFAAPEPAGTGRAARPGDPSPTRSSDSSSIRSGLGMRGFPVASKTITGNAGPAPSRLGRRTRSLQRTRSGDRNALDSLVARHLPACAPS